MKKLSIRALLASFFVVLSFGLISSVAGAATSQAAKSRTVLLQGTLLSRTAGAFTLAAPGGTYAVSVNAAGRVLDRNWTRAALSSFAPGNTIRVYGRATGNHIAAQTVRDISVPSNASGAVFTGYGNAVVPAPALPEQEPAPLPAGPNASEPKPTFTFQPSDPGIDPKSIVGVLCFYDYKGAMYPVKGSGVVIGPDGLVLTAKHVVDPQWTYAMYSDTLSPKDREFFGNAVLNHCEIGVPEGIALPGAIQNSDPGFLITHNFQYNASLYFEPGQSGLSPGEFRDADFAILQITSPTAACRRFNASCDMGHFSYARTASGAMPGPGSDQVTTYGYPVEAGLNDTGKEFFDFYLKGAAGTVGSYWNGDQALLGQPLKFSLEAGDIQSGRSGSPLFSNGRVIGMLYGSTSRQESYNLTMPAIARILSLQGFGSVLESD